MAYQTAATPTTLSDLQEHSPIASFVTVLQHLTRFQRGFSAIAELLIIIITGPFTHSIVLLSGVCRRL